jgi:hypothetical protein
MNRALLVVFGLLVSSPAWALDTWMWGIGPKIGTNALPGGYPLAFPKAVVDNSLDKARFDLLFGASAYYYASQSSRLGLDLQGDFGKGFDEEEAILKYNWVYQGDAIDFVTGLGLGAGVMHFHDTAGADQTDAKMLVNDFPVRGEIGALVRDGTRGYQGNLFGQLGIPTRSVYTDPDGLQDNVGFGLYLMVGIEVSVLFGDFEPPRSRH